MNQLRTFKQYIWLVTTILNHRLTLEQISRKWAEDQVSDGSPLSRSTFHRHRDSIFSLFGLNIECDLNDYTYYIDNPATLNDGTVEHWLFSTMAVNVALSESVAASDRIILENVPAGEHFLSTMIQAIRQNRRIRLGYRKFGSEGYVKTVDPYAMRLSKRRWYVLAFNGERIANYSFDRIQSVELTDEHFQLPEGFSPQAFYSEYIGVLTDGTPLEHIRLRAYGRMADYLRTLPLHHSQQELEGTDEYTDFSLDVRPTADFIGELLSRDELLEVLEPESLRVKMCSKLEKMLNKYKKS